ncbi:MAG: copper chaperone PCu(A)C [Pseudomonadota bacterium]
MKKTILAALTSTLIAGSAFAHDYKIGDLVINHPVARATPVNAPVSGGYMTITNTGSVADRLVAATVGFAGEVQIHEMSMQGDVMKMRQLEDGLEIPAGEKVMLQPGGFHIMFMKLEKQLKEGEKYDATLVFEKAGSVEVTLNVENLMAIKEALGGGEMKMEHKTQ